MKSGITVTRTSLIALAITAVSLLLISWDDQPNGFHWAGDFYFTDTVPPKKAKTDRENKVRNLDEEIEQLEKADIDRELKNAMKEVERALKQIDVSKMHQDVEKALKEFDWKKIRAEIDESLAKIEGEKLRADFDKALKEIDFEKIKAEIKESFDKLDFDKIKSEVDMEKMKADMKEVESELKKIRPELEQSLQKAKLEIEKAKMELKVYRNFIDRLEQDGLISKKDGYSVKHEDGELIINCKKQPRSVYNKYQDFLEKHKKFEFDNRKDDLKPLND